MTSMRDHFKSAAAGVFTVLAPAACIAYSLAWGNNAYSFGNRSDSLIIGATVTCLAAVTSALAFGTSSWNAKRLTSAVATIVTVVALGAASYQHGLFDERQQIMPKDWLPKPTREIQEPPKLDIHSVLNSPFYMVP